MSTTSRLACGVGTLARHAGGLGADPVDVDPYTRPHGGRQRDLLDVPALGGGRLHALQLVHDGSEVRGEIVETEARLADRHLHDTVAAGRGAVLHLAALE